MAKYFILFLKGLIVGIGKILPGISGSVLAISLNIYETSLDKICNFKRDIKNNTLYLLPIFIGVIISIAFLSKVLLIIYNKYNFIFISVVIGLIIGTIPKLLKEIKNYKKIYWSLILSVFLLPKHHINNNLIFYITLGIIEAITTVLPGISSSAIYMNMDIYDKYLNIFFNINVCTILFIIGLLFGLLLTMKIVNYLFKKHKEEMYIIIVSFLIYSIISLLRQLEYNNITNFFIYLLIGFVISLYTNK